jgi:hypothetical protein
VVHGDPNYYLQIDSNIIIVIGQCFILAIADFVMKNSYVEYEGRVYVQVIGTAMGTSLSVQAANCYVYQLNDSDRAYNLYNQSIVILAVFLYDFYKMMIGYVAQTLVSEKHCMPRIKT